MHPQRVEKQFAAASCHPNTVGGCMNWWSLHYPPLQLIGSGFIRLPQDSTERYTRWSNTLSVEQLYTQVMLHVHMQHT